MAHKKKVKKGKTSERKTAKKGKSRRSHESKKQTTKRTSSRGSDKRKRGSGSASAKKTGSGGTGVKKGGSGKSPKDTGGHRREKEAPYRYIPEWLRAKSERSKAAWRVRWDRGTAPIGKVGQKYIQDTYGPTITPSDFGPVGGGGGGVPAHDRVFPSGDVRVSARPASQDEEQDDFEDYYDDFDFYDREY
jgi:hypothetical protein